MTKTTSFELFDDGIVDDEVRDRPLRFEWNVDPDAYDFLGLPPAMSRKSAKARASIVAEAYAVGRANGEQMIAYSRDDTWYAKRSRYMPYGRMVVVSGVDGPAALGWFENNKTPP